jgi:hypothetical protein
LQGNSGAPNWEYTIGGFRKIIIKGIDGSRFQKHVKCVPGRSEAERPAAVARMGRHGVMATGMGADGRDAGSACAA